MCITRDNKDNGRYKGNKRKAHRQRQQIVNEARRFNIPLNNDRYEYVITYWHQKDSGFWEKRASIYEASWCPLRQYDVITCWHQRDDGLWEEEKEDIRNASRQPWGQHEVVARWFQQNHPHDKIATITRA